MIRISIIKALATDNSLRLFQRIKELVDYESICFGEKTLLEMQNC